MITIVHLITGLNAGGAELALLRLLQGLDAGERKRHRVISMIEAGPVATRITALGVPVASLGMKPGQISPGGLWQLLGHLRRAGDWRLQGWMYHADLLATLACVLLVRPRAHIWSIHHGLDNLAHEKLMTRTVIRLLAWLSFLPARIIYVGQRIRTQHEALGYNAARSVTIPHGVDTGVYKPAPSGVQMDNPRIGMLGRWDPIKNHAGFFAALAQIPGAHGVLLGSGMVPENAELQQLIARHGLQQRVELLGQRDDAAQVMAGLTLLCMCSHSEAGPLVVAEAMACGAPCVATDVGDAALMIGDEGWVVPPRDHAALVAALNTALNSPDLAAMGRRARARIEAQYAMAQNIAAYRQLYRDLGWCS